MPLTKMQLPPSYAGYSAQDGEDTAAIKLDGGRSRYRLGVIVASKKVDVQWTITPAQFEYLRAFYNAVAKRGSLPFLIDLQIDKPDPIEHQAYFVPGTMKHTSPGGYFVVNASLEVVPNAVDEAYDESLVVLIGSFGFDDEAIENALLSIEYLVNTAMPDAAPP